MADIHWLNNESGDFDTSADWSGGVVPAVHDNATIATANKILSSVFVTQDETVRSLTTIGHLDHSHKHFYCPIVTFRMAIFSAKSISNGGYFYLEDSELIATGDLRNTFVIETGINDPARELIKAKNLINTGVIVAQNLDLLTIDAPVTGKGGRIDIGFDTITFNSTVDQQIFFVEDDGYPSGIVLANSVGSSVSITGLDTSGQPTVDLEDIGFVDAGEATFSGTKKGGVLTVTDGAHTATIKLEGNYLNATFTASSDGHGGTIVVDNDAEGPAQPHAFISTMASFAALPAHTNHFAEAWSARESLFAAPRVALA